MYARLLCMSANARPLNQYRRSAPRARDCMSVRTDFALRDITVCYARAIEEYTSHPSVIICAAAYIPPQQQQCRAADETGSNCARKGDLLRSILAPEWLLISDKTPRADGEKSGL